MGSFSQVAKACRSLKFIVVEDRLERFAIKRKMEQRFKLLRMRLKLKKKRITKMCTEWALHAGNSIACGWEKGRKIKNISMVWQNEMLGIKWSGKHQAMRAGLGFALVEDVQFVADVMGSVGLQIKPKMIEISNSVSIGNIEFKNERYHIKLQRFSKSMILG